MPHCAVCVCALPLAKVEAKNRKTKINTGMRSHISYAFHATTNVLGTMKARVMLMMERRGKVEGKKKMFRMIFLPFLSVFIPFFYFSPAQRNTVRNSITRNFLAVLFFCLNRYSGPGELAFVGRCSGSFGCLVCTNFTHRNTPKTEASTELMEYT